VPLKHLAEYQNGFAFKPEHRGAQGRPIIRIAQLTSNEPAAYYDGPIDPRVVVHPGDLLFSWSATLDSYLWDGPEALLNQHIFRVTPTPSVEKRYLYYVLKSVVGLLGDHHAHGSTMTHIKREDLSHKVPVPPLDEQRRIAAFLDQETARIDELVTEQVRLGELIGEKKAQEMKQRLLQGNGSGGASEEQYTMKLGWLCRIHSGTDAKTDHGEVRLYGANGPIGRTDRATFSEDLVLVGRVGSAGSVTLASGDFGVSDNALVLEHSKALLPKYLYYVMLDQDLAKGVSTTAQPLITASFLRALRVPVPPLNSQAATVLGIEAVEATFDSLLAATAAMASLLAERRSTLITAAVTGQIDVRTWTPPADWPNPEAA
jgi:type I restriction enzyme, S subunit